MKDGQKQPADKRKARLAEQLRANLKRRKEQTRARRSGEKPDAGEPPADDDVSR